MVCRARGLDLGADEHLFLLRCTSMFLNWELQLCQYGSVRKEAWSLLVRCLFWLQQVVTMCA